MLVVVVVVVVVVVCCCCYYYYYCCCLLLLLLLLFMLLIMMKIESRLFFKEKKPITYEKSLPTMKIHYENALHPTKIHYALRKSTTPCSPPKIYYENFLGPTKTPQPLQNFVEKLGIGLMGEGSNPKNSIFFLFTADLFIACWAEKRMIDKTIIDFPPNVQVVTEGDVEHFLLVEVDEKRGEESIIIHKVDLKGSHGFRNHLL